MSIAAINEQLLRAVGVGLALFDAASLELRYANELFGLWFEDATGPLDLQTYFPKLDVDAMRAGADAGSRYVTETQIRRRRRTLVLSQVFSRAEAGGESLYVLECQNVTRIRELEAMIDSYSKMVERNLRELQREKEKVERLLLNIMPRSAYEEHQALGTVTPQRFPDVAVLVLDFLDFTQKAEASPPATFVSELNELYGAFDRIGDQFVCERIKTNGDTYLCVAGMQTESENPAVAAANVAIRFIRYLNARNENAAIKWQCRIGIGAGPVVGSVIGAQKYVYDVFGAAVDEAYGARASAAAMEAVAAGEAARRIDDALPTTEGRADGQRIILTQPPA